MQGSRGGIDYPDCNDSSEHVYVCSPDTSIEWTYVQGIEGGAMMRIMMLVWKVRGVGDVMIVRKMRSVGVGQMFSVQAGSGQRLIHSPSHTDGSNRLDH